MITKFKLFENFYEDGNFWYIEIAVNDYSAFSPYLAPADFDTLDNVIKYAKEVIETLNKSGVEFKVYTNNTELKDVDGLIFLFKNEKDIPDTMKGHLLNLTPQVYSNVWEGREISDNDLDRFFNSEKFGL